MKILVILLACMANMFANQNDEITLSIKKHQVHKSQKSLDLFIENKSNKSLYYFVTLARKRDTGWVSIRSDIKNLGFKETIIFKEIKSKETKVERLKFSLIPDKKLLKGENLMRLKLMYSTTPNIVSSNFGQVAQEFSLIK